MSDCARINAIAQRFDDLKYEDLYPVCCSQIATLYSNNPFSLNPQIHRVLFELILSPETHKRTISSSILSYILRKMTLKDNINDFYFESNSIEFDINTVISEIERDKKSTPNQLEQLSFPEQLFAKTYDQIRLFLSRRENFLYSKNEKHIREKEKKSKRNNKSDEEQFLNTISEEMLRNNDFNYNSVKNKNPSSKTDSYSGPSITAKSSIIQK